MVQAGRPGRPDVHRRPLADRLESLEDLDAVGRVGLDVSSRPVAVVPAGTSRARAVALIAASLRPAGACGRVVSPRLSFSCVPSSLFELPRSRRQSPRSDPHRHDDVGVVVTLGADRFHHRLADFVLPTRGHDVGRDCRRKSSTYCALKQICIGAPA